MWSPQQTGVEAKLHVLAAIHIEWEALFFAWRTLTYACAPFVDENNADSHLFISPLWVEAHTHEI